MSVNTIEKMIDWVEVNLSNNPTLPQMAKYVGYSEYYCSSKFHEFTGVTFKEYVLKRKLALAASSLLETDDKILDIALNYGFSSNEAFSRSFCKEYGCSPRNFRTQKPHIDVYERFRLL